MSAIASIYAKKVANGSKSIDDVPEAILSEVKEILGITDDDDSEEETDE